LSPTHWDAVVADLNGAGAGADSGGAAVSAASTADLSALFPQDVYSPIHTAAEDWIASDLGKEVDGFMNKLAGSYVIGDGTPGTAADPTGGAGGWLFGDGGAGWNSDEAGAAGGNGGAAGFFGNGGAGGAGGAGAAGGAGGAGGSLMGIGGAGGNGGAGADGGNGGDGGDATGLFGIGGDGGNGGNSGVGGAPTGLPALGGAGGNGGLFGSHGAVGHFGTGATSTASSDLSSTDGWLTDSDGKVVILHGVNLVDKTPPFEPSVAGFTDADAAQLEASGVNAVRLGVQWAGVEPEPGVFNDAYLASLAQTVQTLADHHIRVVLDMHQDEYSDIAPGGGDGAPAWAVDTGGLPYPNLGFPYNYITPAVSHAFDTFWANGTVADGVRLENNYTQMWEHVANYFKNDPDVVGYEIMNEPWPGSQWLATVFGSPYFDTQELTPFYNQVDSAIRAVDPTTPVFFEPNVLFGNLPVNTHLGTVDDPNTVFAFHPYCLATALLGSNSDFGCSAYENVIDGWAADYAKAHDIPAMITEFGNTDDSTVLTTEMDAANQHGFGWLYWPVGQYATSDNLETLGQPYPQVVAGTPNSWSFDSDSDTFNLSYSTERADGLGDFPAGAQTTISVPTIEYPNGYQ
ncbi:MAG: cellulase family glycosylhydrolase, partial [Mycobacterium sp.]